VQLILRCCLSSQGKAWQALHLSPTFSKLLDATPASHPATHHAAFSASAICKVQLILRRLGANGGAGAECPAFVNGTAWVNMPKENSATRYASFATKEAVQQLLLALKKSLLFWDIKLYLGFFLL